MSNPTPLSLQSGLQCNARAGCFKRATTTQMLTQNFYHVGRDKQQHTGAAQGILGTRIHKQWTLTEYAGHGHLIYTQAPNTNTNNASSRVMSCQCCVHTAGECAAFASVTSAGHQSIRCACCAEPQCWARARMCTHTIASSKAHTSQQTDTRALRAQVVKHTANQPPAARDPQQKASRSSGACHSSRKLVSKCVAAA
jgi:hypothetical protein